MGWQVLSKPGVYPGPCKRECCGHTDCAWKRTTAAARCTICGDPIGYQTKFYGDTAEGWTHAACEWAVEERRQADMRKG